MRTSEGVGKKYAHTMISTATKPQSIFPPRSFIAPIVTRNDSYQRLDLCRRCLRGIEFLSRTQRLVSRSSSTGARAKREPLTSTATSPGSFKGLGPRVPLDVYHHRSMENLGLQATDLFA